MLWDRLESMNRIVLDKERVIQIEEDLEIVVPDICEKEIYLCSQNKNVCINYQVGKNSHLIVHHYNINSSFDIRVDLQGEGASIEYFYSTVNEENQKFLYHIFHNASKTESNVINHGINAGNGSLVFDIYPYVLKSSEACICNQENSIINLGEGESTIRPNLLIDNYNVISNHSAYIGAFREEELFYLMSRGLSERDSYELLMKSFLVDKAEKIEEIFPEFLGKLREL